MERKPHILFVDDDTNILTGLRRGLHTQRNHWQMSFAHSGIKALEVIETNEIDIIVSDMRMPEMDGAELLEKARELSPGTARIVLSGYAKDEIILKAVGPAHQYLAKPCDFDVLQETIQRILQLRACFDQHDVRKIITGMKSLPSLPEVYQELISELESPNSTNLTIAKVLEKDLGLKSQVLKVCNSAFFGLPQHVNDLSVGVSLLGVNTLRSMALLKGIFSASVSSNRQRTILQKLCTNSIQIGLVAQKIARQSGIDHNICDLISCAGTLSHIGSLIIATSWPEEFEQAAQMAEEEKASIDTFERKLIGVDHATIGGYFLGLWGFPLQVCEAVAYHHRPELCNNIQHPILASLHISQQLTKVFAQDKIDLTLLEGGIDQAFLAKQGLIISVDEWSKIIRDDLLKGEKNDTTPSPRR